MSFFLSFPLCVCIACSCAALLPGRAPGCRILFIACNYVGGVLAVFKLWMIRTLVGVSLKRSHCFTGKGSPCHSLKLGGGRVSIVAVITH